MTHNKSTTSWSKRFDKLDIVFCREHHRIRCKHFIKEELKKESIKTYQKAIKLFRGIKKKLGQYEPMTSDVVIVELMGLLYKEKNE